MTRTRALKELYKAIVGEDAPANANSITKLLLLLADNWPSGGSSDDTVSEA